MGYSSLSMMRNIYPCCLLYRLSWTHYISVDRYILDRKNSRSNLSSLYSLSASQVQERIYWSYRESYSYECLSMISRRICNQCSQSKSNTLFSLCLHSGYQSQYFTYHTVTLWCDDGEYCLHLVHDAYEYHKSFSCEEKSFVGSVLSE